MTQKTRRRRVADYRKQVEDWAVVEGVSAGELLGYLLYLESYSANRALSSFAWNIFTGQFQSDKPEVSLEEAIWMIEKGSISQAVYTEIRLRFMDRIKFPPLHTVRAENKVHRPSLIEYKKGVKAPLYDCLQSTLLERVQVSDLSS